MKFDLIPTTSVCLFCCFLVTLVSVAGANDDPSVSRVRNRPAVTNERSPASSEERDETYQNCMDDFGNQSFCSCLARNGGNPMSCPSEETACVTDDNKSGNWNKETRKCEPRVFETGCPNGEKRNPVTGACDKGPDPDPEPLPDPIAACTASLTKAQSDCDSSNGSWMHNIQQSASMMGGTLHQMNPSMCGGIAAAQTGAQSGIATYQVMCQNAVQACMQTCNGPALTSQRSSCTQLRQQAAAAQQEVAKAMLTLKSSVQACQNAFGDLNNQAKAHCDANPEACKVDFPSMIGANSAEMSGGGSGGSLDMPGVGGANPAVTGIPGGLEMEDDPRAMLGANGQASGGGLGMPGGPPIEGGNAPQGGGNVGVGAGPAGRGNGKPSGGLLTNILSGFFGTGGGSGGGAGGFIRRALGLGNSGADRDSNSRPSGPDLRQFLPGGIKDPGRNRGIAGQFIGRDGMTGPHSNIWKNISNRYQYKRASLLP